MDDDAGLSVVASLSGTDTVQRSVKTTRWLVSSLSQAV